jgi:hypothetical protein
MIYQTLRDTITAAIDDNNQGEITGLVLQGILLSLIDKLGINHFKGVATPSNAPGADFEEGFYIGLETGIYPSYGNFSVNEGVNIFWKTLGVWQQPINIASGVLGQIGIGDGVTVPWMTKLENIAPTPIQDKFMNILATGNVSSGDITNQVGAVISGAVPVGEGKYYTFWGYGDSHTVGAYSGSNLNGSNWIGTVSTTEVNTNPSARKFLVPSGCTHINIQLKESGEGITSFNLTEGEEYTLETGKIIIDGSINGAWIIQTKDLLGKIQQNQLSQSLQDRLDDFEARITALE